MSNTENFSTQLIDHESIQPARPWHQRPLIRTIIYHGFVILASFAMIYPILWLIGSSLKGADEIWTNQAALIPDEIKFENYTNGWKGFGSITFTTFYKNSFIYAGIGTLLTVSASAPQALCSREPKIP